MLPIRTILHPTDFSECSNAAFHLACALARDYRARLVVAHVAAPAVAAYGKGLIVHEAGQEERERLQQALHSVRPADPAIRVEYKLREGDTVTEVLALAAECQADLIVMGTHGRGALGRLLMGSVAEPVVRRAACPVLTVRVPLSQPEMAPGAGLAAVHAAKAADS